MDFGSLLHRAQKNEKTGKNEVSYYKTKFEPPKKENKSKTLSANIQKFLAKKEEEERRKSEETKKKRDELLALRDTKTNNRIRKMLKVIKSANKSVLDDAVDNNDTAVTMAGPDQPDEDDYGYVSQEASAFYSKMMEKYKTIPEEEKFSSSKKSVNHDLASTKDRVRAAIIRHQEEESMPHKRKRKSRNPEDVGNSPNDYDDDYDDKPKEEEKVVDKPKPKRPAPPPMNFSDLLKIAEKKQFEPIVVEAKKPEKVEEPERLMTKKQKREYEQYKAFKEAKMRREQERVASDQELPRKSLSDSSEKEAQRKPKPDLSLSQSKPINPLSIRIPKVGEKSKLPNSTESKKPNNDSNHQIRQLEKDKSKISSGNKYKKEDLKSDRKYDDVKNIKPNNSYPSSSSSSKFFEKPSSNLTKPSNSTLAKTNTTHISGKPEMQKNNVHKNDKVTNKIIQPEKRLSSSNSNGIQRSNHSSSSSSSSQSKFSGYKPNNSSRDFGESSTNNKMLNHSKDSRESLIKKTKPDHPIKKEQPLDSRSQLHSNSSKSEKRPDLFKPLPNKSSSAEQSKSLNKNVLHKDSIKPQIKGDKNVSEKVVKKSPMDNKDVKPSVSSNAKFAKPSSSEAQRSKMLPPQDVKKPRPHQSDVKGPRQLPPPDVKGSKQFPPSDVKGPRQFPPPDVKGSRQFPPSDVKGPRQFPPPDVKGSRQFPPTDVRGPRQFPPRDINQRKEKRPVKRQILDDDSEYDSELDDFIDDGPLDDGNDYSKYIKEIFGYDKSRYRDLDEDDSNMESNFAQVMREEYISKKIGLMEDLEDMKMEAMEKKKKTMQKKRRRIDDDD